MSRPIRRVKPVHLACTITLSVLLAGCGGGSGGGGGPVSAPPPVAGPAPSPPIADAGPPPSAAPAPAPTPAPAPAPAPIPAVVTGSNPQAWPVVPTYDTREFRRSDGAVQHNAASAWQAGSSGKGVTIAIVDSGIDQASPEFASRISAASRDLYAGRDALTGSYDHGTRVAQVAAAARNGSGVLGIAWGATILALRTDQPGTCDGAGGTSACAFADSAIAEAVTYASDNGARVINVSLGGGSASQVLTEAVRAATAKGALVVVAAGNDGLPGPTGFTTNLAMAGEGGVLVVGSVDADGALSDYSNRAGEHASGYLAARGEAVCCAYTDGELYLDPNGYGRAFSGTSFAAPQVAGAAALLAQAFPHLSGRQIAAILLESAFDAGAAGLDPVYGSGILDIARAFQPLGATAIAGQQVALAPGAVTAATSAAMGDALQSIALQTLVTDKYARAFTTDLAPGIRGAAIAPVLSGALDTRRRAASLGDARAAFAFSFAAPDEVARLAGARGAAPGEPRDRAQMLGARASFALAHDTSLALGFRQDMRGLQQQLRGGGSPAFMVAPGAGEGIGAILRSDLALGLRQRIGDWGVTLAAASASTALADHRPLRAAPTGLAERGIAREFGLTFDRAFGQLAAALGASLVREEGALLGARFHDALGLAGAETLFIEAEAGWQLAPGLALGAAWRRGFTHARAGGLVESGTGIGSDAWSLDLAGSDVLAPGDSLALRLSQPLRVSGGALVLGLPSAWDYATLTAETTAHDLALAPQGRELTAELAWSGRLFAGEAAASLFYRREPGHYAAAAPDAGLAIRWSRGL